jgi:VanZ family protein
VGNLPWLRPGIVISVLIAMALGGAVSRALGASRAIGTLLIASTGFIVSATLTPLRFSFEGGAGAGRCDLSRLWPAPPDLLFSLNDASLNVVLFVPLGIAVGLLPPSSRRNVVAVGAIALPFVIETTQLLVTPLLRGCESADVIDNLTGLVIGWIAAVVLRRLYVAWRGSRLPAKAEES